MEELKIMNENNLNAELNEEAVQPQYNKSGAEVTDVTQEEITEPRKDVENMSDEEFLSYIKSAQNGDVEVQNDSVKEEKTEAADEETTPAEAKAGTEDADSAGAAEKPFKVFNTQEEYQGVIDGIIGERLKKSREGMESLERLKRYALNFYDTDDGDAALSQLMEDLQQQNADKHGVSMEEYERQTRDSIDAQKYREERERVSNEQQRIAQIQQKWQNESEELKKIVPAFDFAKAMQNQTFYNGIVSGMSVSTAYLAANKSTEQAQKPQRRVIAQNGSMKGGTANAAANPASMSDADFMAYIERLKE